MEMTTVRRYLDRLAQVWRQRGSRTAMQWVAYRSVQRLTGVSVTHIVWLDVANFDDSLRPDNAYTFKFLSADEVRNYSTDPENWLNPALADGIDAGTNFCFAALAQGRLAAFVWFTPHAPAMEHCGGTPLSFPSDVAYMYHCYTIPDFRGRRLHGLTTGLGLRALGDRGITKLVASIDWANWASKQSCFRLGFIDLGYAVVFQCGRLHIGSYPRDAKSLGIKFGRAAVSGHGDFKEGVCHESLLDVVESQEPISQGPDSQEPGSQGLAAVGCNVDHTVQ